MILSTAAVAKLIEVPEGTLRYWRYMDEGPRSFRLGRHVKYHSEDVEEWVSRQAIATACGDTAKGTAVDDLLESLAIDDEPRVAEPPIADEGSDSPELAGKVAGLSASLQELSTKVEATLRRMGSQSQRDRSSRVRNTVSSRIGDAFDPHGFYVYLLWGEDPDTPLYIGLSRNVLGRLGAHMNNADRRDQIRSVQLIKCSGESTMKRTEAALIREYRPPLNTIGVA